MNGTNNYQYIDAKDYGRPTPIADPDSSENSISLISAKQLYARLNEELDTPIGIHAVYELMKKRDFPAIRIKGRLFAIESEIKRWLIQQTRKTA